MRRLIWFGLKVAALIAVTLWLIDNPGEVNLVWLGWRVDTSVAVFALGIGLVVVAATMGDRVLRALLAVPRVIGERRGAGRTRRGLEALTQGFTRLAAGDAGRAARAAEKADRLLPDPLLPSLLRAEAARVDGGGARSVDAWAALSELPAGRLLAARPLAESALAARDLPLAMEHVRRGLTVDPQAPALLRLRHELDMRLGRWADAQESLRALARARLIDGDQLNRRAALVWLGRARAAERDQAINDAADHARRAWKTLPAFLPAAIESARLDLASGRAARASQTIESSWTSCPHPDLAAAYLDAQPGADPLTQVKRCQLLVERAPRAAESHLAQGNAARKARLWGEARRHYQTALDLDPTVARRAAIGLAQVAIAEPPMETLVAATETGGDDPEQPRAALTTRPAEAGVAPELVARVAEAPPERGWLCGACGTPHRRWEPICPTCDGIDTVEWRQPPAMPATSIEAGIPVAAMLLPPVRD